MTQTTTNTNKSAYFDSDFRFAGYVNRARVVKPQQGNPYLAVSLCVLSGKMDKPNKMYIDAIVVGTEAKELIDSASDVINSTVAVFGRFKVADLWLSTYENKEGQTIPIAKGRLVLISYLKAGDEILKSSQTHEDDVNDVTEADVDELNDSETVMDSTEDSEEVEVTEVDIDSLTSEEKDQLLREHLKTKAS